jgi:hypothetical protein
MTFRRPDGRLVVERSSETAAERLELAMSLMERLSLETDETSDAYPFPRNGWLHFSQYTS